MRVRFHRGMLDEAMKTLFEPKDWEDLCKHFEEREIDTQNIECEPYCEYPDKRIGWDKTWIIISCFVLKNDAGEVVMKSKRGPVAFSDENIFELRRIKE